MNFVFDLGNVLVKWQPEKFIPNFDISADEKKLIESEFFGHAVWLMLDKGTISQNEAIAQVAQRSGMNEDIVKYCINEMKKSLETIEQTAALVQKLYENGHELFCLSNMSRDTYNHIKNRSFFACFREIIISADIKMIKPDLEIFEYMLERFELEAEDCVFIDDSAPNIIAAQSLGIHGVHFHGSAECYADILSYT